MLLPLHPSALWKHTLALTRTGAVVTFRLVISAYYSAPPECEPGTGLGNKGAGWLAQHKTTRLKVLIQSSYHDEKSSHFMSVYPTSGTSNIVFLILILTIFII